MRLGKIPCVGGFGLVRFQQMPTMPGTRAPRTLFFAIILAAFAQCVRDFPLLPARIGSHFDASGMANGWMTKTQFFAVYALVLLPALFIEFWLYRKVANTPEDKLQLPNKEYWLAPEHRAGTIAYFQSFFAWYGCAVVFVIATVMGLAIRANFNSPPQLPAIPTVSILLGFVVYNFGAVMLMYRRFSKADGSNR